MKDEELRRRVSAELAWDPQVSGESVDVLARAGVVTLRGTIGGLHGKRACATAAERVRGVRWVVDELRVQIAGPDRRNDEDLQGDVREALMLDASVPMTVDARARDGIVTLTGMVQWHYQRTAAEARTTGVPGVAGVDNLVTLAPSADTGAAQDRIAAAFRRNAVLDADALTVALSPGGLVTLTGTVRSCAAHEQALAAAWSAPGVTEVDDRIRVESDR